jgi:hypothetical protein
VAKFIYNNIYQSKQEHNFHMFGVEIQTHLLSNFFNEVDRKTGEFYEEKEVLKWNKHYERFPMINEISSSNLLQWWFHYNNQDAKQIIKLAEDIGSIAKEIGVLDAIGGFMCDSIGMLCSSDESGKLDHDL